MDFMPLRLNSSSLTCSICALAAIILQLVAMECQKLHMVDSPIRGSYDKQKDHLYFYQIWLTGMSDTEWMECLDQFN